MLGPFSILMPKFAYICHLQGNCECYQHDGEWVLFISELGFQLVPCGLHSLF